MTRSGRLAVALAWCLVACSGATSDDAGMDGATGDGSVADGGRDDGGDLDGGDDDAGGSDAGTDGGMDAGDTDAGDTDAGGGDADGGTADGGTAGEGDPCSASMACAGGLACEAASGGARRCQRPFVVRGTVTDAATGAPIGGAIVIALDESGLAISGSANSAGDASFELAVPAVRDGAGRPVAMPIVLYASASGYLRQPRGFVRSIELDAASAAEESVAWVISATVALIPSGASGLPISGRITAAETASVLVVAEGGGVVRSALSDRDGRYTVFDVPPGTIAVQGYRGGVVLDPVTVTLSAPGASGVDLAPSSALASAVSGTLTFINAPGGSATSVELFVASTFDPELDLGDTPYGLRASGVGSAWTIDGVAPGNYLAVAAVDDDLLVLDPDDSVAGSGLQLVVVAGAGAPVALASSLKVTGAIAIVGPGASGPEAIGAAPTLTWTDAAAEDYYVASVVDARGALVWESANVVGTSVLYAGPLEAGIQYRFRVTAYRDVGDTTIPLGVSEHYRGVFYPSP